MQSLRDDVRHPDAFLVLLLATDVLFIIGHIIFMVMHLVVWDTPGLLDDIVSDYSIVKERGFAETFQYIKAFWLVLMLLWIVIRTREFGYLSWTAMFLYLGLDDLLQIHEEVGNTLATRYTYPEFLGQRPRDLGELTVFAVVGVIALSLLSVAYLTGGERFRQVSRNLVPLVAALALLGIVVDALHIVFLHRAAGAFFGLLEDGGELLVLSLITWYVWRVAGRLSLSSVGAGAE